MSESHRWTAGSPRRTFLKTAAGLAAGTVLAPGAQWAQSGDAGGSAFPKINPRFMITPDQAWDWNAFKSRGGPTYAGSAGWKRYTDFLISKLHEFGAVDFDYVEIPYDHHIVDDWPDRRTHVFDSGIAVEKLVIDGTPVPVVASYGMTSGYTPPEGVTAQMLFYDPAKPPSPEEIAGKILVFETAPYPDPPYSNSFLDNFTLTDYEWRSPGKWTPLFTPSRRASLVPIIPAGSGANSTALPRSGSGDMPRLWWLSTTFRPALRSGWRSAASTRRTERRGSARSTSTVPLSRSIG